MMVINRFIQETFYPIDQPKDFEDIHVVSLLEKSQQHLYEGSKKKFYHL